MQYKSPQDSLKMNKGRKGERQKSVVRSTLYNAIDVALVFLLKEGEKNSYKKLQIPKMQGHRE